MLWCLGGVKGLSLHSTKYSFNVVCVGEIFQTRSWTFCETASYKSTFRRSKQQHSRMQIMTQLRVLSMRIAEVPGPCETPAIQSQQDSLFPGK